MPLDGRLWFYIFFHGTGRELLADALGDPDPFRLSGSEIVERVLAAGYGPDLQTAQRFPFPATGRVDTVDRNGLRFIVSVALMSEAITVQEQRENAYAPE